MISQALKQFVKTSVRMELVSLSIGHGFHQNPPINNLPDNGTSLRDRAPEKTSPLIQIGLSSHA